MIAQQPAVLVLSLPRSGSSWVGESLGCAINALYLREPVTQSDPLFHNLGTVFAIDTPDVEVRYQQSADKAFAGSPDFGGAIVRFPERWTPVQNGSGRLVIKEVNPRACGWYLEHYAPRVVLLVRHPGAVALSWQRKGWLGADPESWAMNGELQGRALREALDALKGHEAQRIVAYEDLCADPINVFKSLFDFAGLTWEADAERFVTERVRMDDANNPWHTSRNSREMIQGWRQQAVQEHVSALCRTYGEFDLPWYRDARDWDVRASENVA